MTLTIFGPGGGGPLGPGIESRTQWTVPDQFPVTASWSFDVMEATGHTDQVMLRHQFTLPGNAGAPNFLLGDPAAGTRTFPSFHFVTVQGDEARYRIEVRDTGSASLLDTVTQVGVWDGSYAWKLQASGSGTGAFTDDDRADLVLVKSAVYRDEGALSPGGIPIVSQIIDLMRGPPMSLLRRGTTQSLSGRGVLSPLKDGNGNTSFGASWSWFTVPAGFGSQDGQLREYFNRMAQFLVIREAGDDTSYIDELVDSNAEGGFLLWKFPSPTEVRYDIAPGVVVIWQWMIS